MKPVLARLGAVFIGVVGALILTEAALRVAYPAYKNFYVWPPGTSMIFQPPTSVMAGVSRPARFTINAAGVRGRDLPSSGYRILAVGGSTTECAYLDDSRAWPALLERLLEGHGAREQVWVGNVGRSGMNSRDHVLHIKYLPRQYPGIDAIVALVGVNDLTVALSQHRRGPVLPVTTAAAESMQIRRAFAIAPGRLTDAPTDELFVPGSPWYKQTALYQLLKRVRVATRDGMVRRGRIQDSAGTSIVTWRAHRKNASRILDDLPLLDAALSEYTTNLDLIASLAHAQGIRLVLLTQPTLWRADLPRSAEDLLWLGGIGDFQQQPGSPYYSPAALAEGMRRFNETLLDVCRARHLECLDLAVTIPKDTSVFYDDTHFTEYGAALVAEEVARFLRARPPWGPLSTEWLTQLGDGS